MFGTPKAAIFSHIDSIGFTVRYNNEIIKIGGPVCDEGMSYVEKIQMDTLKVKYLRKIKNYI